MTYLELAQQTLLHSDTGSPDRLPTLSDVSTYQSQIVSLVADAWRLVQNKHERWTWRQAEFEAELRAGTDTYNWNDLHQTGSTVSEPLFSIPRDPGFRDWHIRAPGDIEGPEWYLTAPAGANRQISTLIAIDFEESRRRRIIFDETSRPTLVAITPQRELVLHATPDDGYILRGRYVIGAQTMTSENHVPFGLPEEYHDVIVWRAVMMAHGNDEASESYAWAHGLYKEKIESMERIFLPDFTVGGALA